MAFVHAFLTITLLAEQVVSGLALTLLGSGLASFLGQRLGPGGMPLVGQIGPRFGRIAIPFLSELPLLGPSVFNRDILTYVMYFFVLVAWYFIYRTRPGLHLRAIGESPQTADAMGVNVFALRYFYTVVGGILEATVAFLLGVHSQRMQQKMDEEDEDKDFEDEEYEDEEESA